jgi:hypothetical protein
MRWAPALSGAAAVVFIIVVGADVLTQSSPSNDLAASRSESTGIIAADGAMPEASMSKTGDDAAAGAAPGGPITPPDTGTFVPTLGLEDDGSGVSEYQVPSPGELEGTQGDPTGSPPDGDAPVPDTRFESEQGSEGPAGSAPTGDFLPPTALANEAATQATNDALVERQVPGPTGTPAEVQAFSDNGTDDEGNRTGLRIVQIAAAAVAVLAGAAFVATRWRGRKI